MPKSDTWPGEETMDMIAHTDSAGHCNSVVNLNSGSGDNSLEYLSAEERACLMFLEETIQSLEAEEDSNLSSPEPERLPGVTSSLATRIAHLSCVMARSKQGDLPKYLKKPPKKEVDKDEEPSLSNRVATPLILANNNSSIQLKGGLKVSSEKANVSSKPSATAADQKPESAQNKRRSDYAVPRGPLSYDELIELRKGTSSKKATASSSSESKTMQSPDPSAVVQPHNGSCLSAPAMYLSVQPTAIQEPSQQKLNPPIVPPKPKVRQSSIIHKPSTQVAVSADTDESYLSTFPNEKIVMNPQRVRDEALRKLGLLNSNEALLHSGRTRQSSEPTLAHPDPDLPQILISETLPSSSQGTKAGLTNFQAARSSGVKSATLERLGLGLAGSMANYTSTDHGYPKTMPKGPTPTLRNSRPRPSSLGNQKDFEGIQDKRLHTAPRAPVLQEAGEVRPISIHRPHGTSVVIKPQCSTGEDRQEALRKLGLLKNKKS
ncbi:specifically androgen-regulated gene protein-like isoform X1 [Arapaima gigas]